MMKNERSEEKNIIKDIRNFLDKEMKLKQLKI